jgi:hypothetical protein
MLFDKMMSEKIKPAIRFHIHSDVINIFNVCERLSLSLSLSLSFSLSLSLSFFLSFFLSLSFSLSLSLFLSLFLFLSPSASTFQLEIFAMLRFPSSNYWTLITKNVGDNLTATVCLRIYCLRPVAALKKFVARDKLSLMKNIAYRPCFEVSNFVTNKNLKEWPLTTRPGRTLCIPWTQSYDFWIYIQIQRQCCSRYARVFFRKIKYFCFRNALGYSWRCTFLQRLRCT